MMRQWLPLTLIGLLLSSVFSIQPVLAQALPKTFASTNPNTKVIMLEFSAPWCLSCKKIQPDLEALEKQLGNKLVVHYLNVEKPENQKYISQFKIESAPSFIIYTGKGKLVQRVERDITAPELRTMINGALKQ